MAAERAARRAQQPGPGRAAARRAARYRFRRPHGESGGLQLRPLPGGAAADCPVEVRATAAGTGSAATRLSLLCWADGPQLRLSWNYPEPLFRQATVARLDREFRAELAALCTPRPSQPSPDTGPAPASVVPSSSVRGDGSVPLVARLLARFRATPGAVAVDTVDATGTVDTADASLTYGALDHASARLAARLHARGVRPGDLVGLLTEPGADTVVGVVGILRAGAAGSRSTRSTPPHDWQANWPAPARPPWCATPPPGAPPPL